MLHKIKLLALMGALIFSVGNAEGMENEEIENLKPEHFKKILIDKNFENIDSLFSNFNKIEKLFNENYIGLYKIKNEEKFLYSVEYSSDPALIDKYLSSFFNQKKFISYIAQECVFKGGMIKKIKNYNFIEKFMFLDEDEILKKYFLEKTIKLYFKKGKNANALYYVGEKENDLNYLKTILIDY